MQDIFNFDEEPLGQSRFCFARVRIVLLYASSAAGSENDTHFFHDESQLKYGK